MSKLSFSVTDFEPEWFPERAQGRPEDAYHRERLEGDAYNAFEDMLVNDDYQRAVHAKNQINRMLDHYLEVKRQEKFHSEDQS